MIAYALLFSVHPYPAGQRWPILVYSTYSLLESVTCKRFLAALMTNMVQMLLLFIEIFVDSMPQLLSLSPHFCSEPC